MRPRARRRRARAAGPKPRRTARSRSPAPPAPRTRPVRLATGAADARADAVAAAGLPRIGQNRLLAPRKSPHDFRAMADLISATPDDDAGPVRHRAGAGRARPPRGTQRHAALPVVR